MSSCYGENIRMTIFGQSHSPAIGVTIEGIPAGFHIDFEDLYHFLDRRAPGKNQWSTSRKEADLPEFVSGIKNDTTCGAPMTALIRNTNTRSSDYDKLALVPRPGHADLTAQVKFGGFQDYAGGGHFSGRLTAPLCIAGGICKQILKQLGISVRARIYSIGNTVDNSIFSEDVSGKEFPVCSDISAEKMKIEIENARSVGDSIGGVIECVIDGVPIGLGDPMFGGMENRISGIVFGIPAVKGIEFGLGFDAARIRGSQNNDPYTVVDGDVKTTSNNAGGILGGITNGMPIVFRAAFKPTPSIAIEQDSVNLKSMQPEKLVITGRHDPCIVPRAVPCIEAAASIAIYDAYLARKKEL